MKKTLKKSLGLILILTMILGILPVTSLMASAEDGYMVCYYPGEADGSPDSDLLDEGTQLTLAECMFTAPEGKQFKCWAIGSLSGEQKQPGDVITITGETYIYAIWEDEATLPTSPIIKNIDIVNVAKPVAGGTPKYTCSLLGSGYEIYETEDYWYRINSIEWTDVTNGGTLLGEDSIFTPGHTYQFKVYLHAKDGYEFAVTGGNDAPATTATVNGNAATVATASNAKKQQPVTYEFECAQKEISLIMIQNLDEPQAGNMPDTAVTTAYPEYYIISNTGGHDYIHWYGNFADDGSFLAGEKYQVEIKVVPTQVDAVIVSKFVSPVSGMINDREVVSADTGFDSADGVLASSSAVYLFCTYEVPASQQQNTAPIAKVYDEAFELDGKVVVEVKLTADNGNKKITVNDTELYYSIQREVYAGIVDASAVSGDTLTGVTVTDTQPTKFVYGNIDGDYDFEDIEEAVDSSDLQALKRYLKGQKTLTGADLICADLDGDGLSDSSDLQALKQFLKTSKIFGILK